MGRGYPASAYRGGQRATAPSGSSGYQRPSPGPGRPPAYRNPVTPYPKLSPNLGKFLLKGLARRLLGPISTAMDLYDFLQSFNGRPQWDWTGWTVRSTQCGTPDDFIWSTFSSNTDLLAAGYCPLNQNTTQIPMTIPANAKTVVTAQNQGPHPTFGVVGGTLFQPSRTYWRTTTGLRYPNPRWEDKPVPRIWTRPDISPENMPILTPTPAPEPAPWADIPPLDSAGRGGPQTDRGYDLDPSIYRPRITTWPGIGPRVTPQRLPWQKPDAKPFPTELPDSWPTPGLPPVPTTWPANEPGQGVGVEVGPGTRPEDLPALEQSPAAGRRPPTKGEKERKFFVHGRAGPIEWIVGGFTESLDFLDAAYFALPCDKQIKGKASPYRKAKQVYDNLGSIRPDRFIDNLIQNELTDRAIAKIGKANGAAARRLGMSKSAGFGGSTQRKVTKIEEKRECK